MSTIRLHGKDCWDNIHYLVIGSRIYLTNPGMVPLALSNEFTDAARLTFELRDIMDGEEDDGVKLSRVIATANKYSRGNRKWEVLK
jgi:hypothetical protein